MKGINVPIMIVSVILSIFLWMFVYVQTLNPPTPVLFAVALHEEGLPEKYIITKMDELYRFTAVGPAEKLRDIRSDSLAAYVDLTNAEPGTRTYPVKVLPETIQEYVTNKNMATKVTIEPLESKQVTVRIEGQGRLKDSQLRLTDTVADPPDVTVRGPKSLVGRATIARVRLDLSTVDTSLSKGYTLPVEIIDVGGRPLEQGLIRAEPLFVRVTPVLTVAPEEKTVFVLPVFKGAVAPGFATKSYATTPRQVTVTGASLVLASISKLQTEPIDISGLNSTTTYTVRLQVPPGLAVSKDEETVQVKVNVAPATVSQPSP